MMCWYWKIQGAHTHVTVFMGGAKCGELCFRNEEFLQVREHCPGIEFIDEMELLTGLADDYAQWCQKNPK